MVFPVRRTFRAGDVDGVLGLGGRVVEDCSALRAEHGSGGVALDVVCQLVCRGRSWFLTYIITGGGGLK